MYLWLCFQDISRDMYYSFILYYSTDTAAEITKELGWHIATNMKSAQDSAAAANPVHFSLPTGRHRLPRGSVKKCTRLAAVAESCALSVTEKAVEHRSDH